MSRYAGKKAVVTGGTHGMGRAMVAALLDGGAEVVLTGRDERNIEAARTELGTRARVVRSDARSMADIDALGRLVEEELGGIDALFVNHGYAKLEPFAEVTEETFDRHFDVNAKGSFFIVQRLAPLVRDGGSIVFTSSVSDEGGYPGMVVYSASKAALWSFAQGFAAELLPRRVRVNAVAPGFIDTPSMGIDAPAEGKAELQRLGDEVTPLRRHGAPEEVAAAAMFLAFDATFSTAVKLPVDGGLGGGISVFPA
ncbi:NAD(P)-dependent dehydrogenase, short-chain alcohol dehydrogenase family [Streptoalloteichus tenebrarius]|uniref:NAD(P)-dependent dehydrogenase, short-chain alcohol dehydrogenase family n=1 Tax=Streptoalloteichus tenebrarius (strain ATCC 17920 / DSM 40477 / JCM 4838 / CBS 697.72 / NBRC 16177 / NCIMB 11028 / NRRL B-12390 / A12253. 1 / ISP 5477) TaxID=1933 RepID=A0ABT1HWT6_STRSD|nr:SDR family oxidoreductase [Streptoalloteichus tenebrarius]MCP2259981.1 NAD(P)-dependent dehydrogenase, short-chain alcohol dehydrogenase family [Streptoalloteichus tenebrarius]BFF03907.1 SDR family oxidoreductase [Streptoalloteichus tenebrarius]